MKYRPRLTLICIALLACATCGLRAQDTAPSPTRLAAKIIDTMLANENAAALHKDRYTYLSVERSDRTNGHLWTEKIVETKAGVIRMLLAEDGQPLSPERIAQERDRLAAIVADPTAFERKSQAMRDDELHARQMLAFVQRAFLFSDVSEENGFLRIDYRPNPAYETQTIEERILHGMTGTMLIDPVAMRLHRIDGHLPQDVTIGFGLLATVHTGSSFSTTRLGQPDWKTTTLDLNIDGHAILFKSLARKQHAEHTNFTRVPDDITVAQAVALAEQ